MSDNNNKKKKKDSASKRGITVSAKRRRVLGINSNIDDIFLKGKRLRVIVSNALVGAQLSRTITGASTVTLDFHDPHHVLSRSPVLESKIDLSLDNLWFRLVGESKSGDQFTLTFEDRAVAYMRTIDSARKGFRDQMTRAEFILSMLREVKQERIPAHIPSLHVEQDIAKTGEKTGTKTVSEKSSSSNKSSGGGIGSAKGLTAKGAPANSSQIALANEAMTAAVKYGATHEILVGLVMALINESVISDQAGGDRDSQGPLQVRTGVHPGVDPHNVDQIVKIFVTQGYTGAGSALSLSKKYGTAEWVGKVLWGAFVTTYPGAPYLDEAREWADAFDGGGLGSAGGSSTTTSTTEKRYAFERERGEDVWDCAGRLADEVNWRRFVSAGVFYYESEMEFAKQKPRLVVNEDKPGIDVVDFDYDVGKKVTEAKITGRAKDWAAPPGTCVLLEDVGSASVDGRYIVTTIESDLFTDSVTITVSRPTKPKLEPAPETVTKTTTHGDDSSGGGSSSGGTTGDLSKVSVKSSNPGSPDWGGAYYVFEQFVTPFMKSKGLSPGSAKRSYNTGSSTSDHYVGSTQAYATDYPTYNGEGIARNIAAAMGNNSWQPNVYGSFTINVDGLSFQVQVLWGAAIDHADHVHVGMHRV